MPLRRQALAIAVALAGAALLVACNPRREAPPAPGDGPGAPAPANAGDSPFGSQAWLEQKRADDRNVTLSPGNSYAKLSYRPEVRMVDEATLAPSLQGVSTDGHGAVFHNAPAEIRGLKTGDVLMVKSRFAVKVLGVGADGDDTVLLFDRARLTDVVEQGQIHFDSAVAFHGTGKLAQAAPSAAPFELPGLLDLLVPPARAQVGAKQDTTQYNGTPPELMPGYVKPKEGIDGGNAVQQAKDFGKLLSDGWTINSYSFTPQGNSAQVKLVIAKDLAGFEGLVKVDGTISNFNLGGDISIPLPPGQKLSTLVKGMSGKFVFSWEIGKKTPGIWTSNDKIRLPVGLTIPLGPLMSGLPLTLDVSMAMLVHPALTGGNEFEAGAFELDFHDLGTDEGLRVDVQKQDSISPVAPTGMVIAFCVPRLELQIAPLGNFSSNPALGAEAAKIDAFVGKWAAKLLPEATVAAFKASPLGNFSLSNALKSQADVFVQLIHATGVTNAPATALAPCKKFQVKVDGEYGGTLNLLAGDKPQADTTKTAFTKTFTRYEPGSDFCKSL